ncbi:MAG: hypothetical protein ACOVRN_10750 [Flavobacterium sp.]
MQITYTTKEESKAAQQEAFLKLSGYERVASFVRLSKSIQAIFPSNVPERQTNNFVIDSSLKRKK